MICLGLRGLGWEWGELGPSAQVAQQKAETAAETDRSAASACERRQEQLRQADVPLTRWQVCLASGLTKASTRMTASANRPGSSPSLQYAPESSWGDSSRQMLARWHTSSCPMYPSPAANSLLLMPCSRGGDEPDRLIYWPVEDFPEGAHEYVLPCSTGWAQMSGHNTLWLRDS